MKKSEPLSTTDRPSPGNSFIVNHEITIIGIIAIIAAAMGFVGIRHYIAANGKHFSPLDMVYFMAQLFVFRTGLNMDSHAVHWTLSIARVLAPAVLGYAALKSVAVFFREQITSFLVRFQKSHVIICGLGDKGLELVKDFRTRQHHVVVIEPNEENKGLTTARILGAMVVIGNATEPSILHKAKACFAKSLYAFTGDDGTNVQIVLAVFELLHCKPRGQTKPLNCFVHVYDTNLASVFSRQPLYAKNQAAITIQIVRTNDISARELLHDFPIDYAMINEKSPKRPHCIIAGFGNMGESVAMQARMGQYAGHNKVRISVVDRQNAEYIESLFLATYPQFKSVADIEFIQDDIESAAFFKQVEQWASEENALTTIVISIHDDTKAFTCALNCLNRTTGRNIPIHVRLDTNNGLAELLNQNDSKENKLSSIHPFGMLSTSCSIDMIENLPIDSRAIKIHEDYVRKRLAKEEKKPSNERKTPENDPSLYPWDRLSSSLKDSNRWQADHIPVKMRAIGCTIGEKNPANSARRVLAFTDKEIELLSIMEHDRWIAERLLAGWKSGERAVENMVSPYLKPWEELDQEIKQRDRNTVSEIPSLLESEGKWIYRNPEQLKT